MKHIEKLMLATIATKSHTYEAIVDKYSGNRYKVVECADCPQLVGREYQYGHGLFSRRKISAKVERCCENCAKADTCRKTAGIMFGFCKADFQPK